MRKITSLVPKEDFHIELMFDDGIEKNFDMKPYFRFPVFSILKDHHLFMQVTNRGYFIEWPTLELDLSADTLWHEGKLL